MKMCDVEKRNVKRYINGIDKYTCTVCGRTTCLDDSVSSRGFHLVCMSCISNISRIMGTHDHEIIDTLHAVAGRERKGFLYKEVMDD